MNLTGGGSSAAKAIFDLWVLMDRTEVDALNIVISLSISLSEEHTALVQKFGSFSTDCRRGESSRLEPQSLASDGHKSQSASSHCEFPAAARSRKVDCSVADID